LKIKHLRDFFKVLRFLQKKYPKTRPLPLPTDQSVSWHDFCIPLVQHFYIYLYNLNNLNKNLKTFENQGVELLR